MKRQTIDTESLVYAYGCGRPISGLEHAYAEHAKQSALWNQLVDIQEQHDVPILAAASADIGRLVGLRDAIYHLGQRIITLIDERAQIRKRELRNAPTPELDNALDLMSAQRKAMRTEFFGLLATWRKEHSDEMRELQEQRASAIKRARQESGLYWGNYNRVIDSFDRALGLVKKTGRRLRRIEDEREGCFTVQIQRTVSGLGAAPAELFTGKFSGLQIGAGDEKQRLMDFRVDAAGNMLRIPVFYHRELPMDCRVKSAQLVWRDGGSRGRQWRLCLTISRPAKTIAHPHPHDAVGIDVGWRLMEDGRLRVAVVCATGNSGVRELSLSPRWMARADHVEKLRGNIDSGTYEGLPPQELRKAQLVVRGSPRKQIGERREQYRLFARGLAMRYGVIGVENLNLAQLALKEPGSRPNRVRAALHVLLDEIQHQAKKHGAQIIKLGGKSTLTCAACGHENKLRSEERELLHFTCAGCGRLWDQDENAAINLMHSAALHASAPVVKEDQASEIKALSIDVRKHYRTARKSVRKEAIEADLA